MTLLCILCLRALESLFPLFIFVLVTVSNADCCESYLNGDAVRTDGSSSIRLFHQIALLFQNNAAVSGSRDAINR